MTDTGTVQMVAERSLNAQIHESSGTSHGFASSNASLDRSPCGLRETKTLCMSVGSQFQMSVPRMGKFFVDKTCHLNFVQ